MSGCEGLFAGVFCISFVIICEFHCSDNIAAVSDTVGVADLTDAFAFEGNKLLRIILGGFTVAHGIHQGAVFIIKIGVLLLRHCSYQFLRSEIIIVGKRHIEILYHSHLIHHHKIGEVFPYCHESYLPYFVILYFSSCFDIPSISAALVRLPPDLL